MTEHITADKIAKALAAGDFDEAQRIVDEAKETQRKTKGKAAKDALEKLKGDDSALAKEIVLEIFPELTEATAKKPGKKVTSASTKKTYLPSKEEVQEAFKKVQKDGVATLKAVKDYINGPGKTAKNKLGDAWHKAIQRIASKEGNTMKPAIEWDNKAKNIKLKKA